MEFNIEADQAGARIRRGVHVHTLFVGDRNATAMINGGRTDLMRLALAIASTAGLRITVDGHIDGNEVARNYSDELKEARAQCQRLANELRRLRDNIGTRPGLDEDGEPPAEAVNAVMAVWAAVHPHGDATSTLRQAGSSALHNTRNLARLAAAAVLEERS